MLETAGVDLVFMPAVDEIYPPGFATLVRVNGLTEGLCGAHRAGHFDGVATVVTKLLIQALPDIAYFGEKDYQQLMVVRRLARDLDIPVHIAGVPTVREPDGLALSSRNVYLSPEERRIAPDLAGVLRSIAAALLETQPASSTRIGSRRSELERAGFEVDYLEVREEETLAPVTADVVGLRAFWRQYGSGSTRLIDNMPIG